MASHVRSRSLTASPAMIRYQVAGFVLALFVALIAFGALWLLNGYWTISFFRRLGVAAWGGLLIHLIISVVEQHLWRAKRVLGWVGLAELWPVIRWGVFALILVVGVIDVGSSATELVLFASSRGWPTGAILPTAVWTVLAEVVAVGAEPLFVVTLILCGRVIRRGVEVR